MAIGYTKIGGTVYEIGPGAVQEKWEDVASYPFTKTLTSRVSEGTSQTEIFSLSAVDLTDFKKVRFVITISTYSPVQYSSSALGTMGVRGNSYSSTGDWLASGALGTFTTNEFRAGSWDRETGGSFYSISGTRLSALYALAYAGPSQALNTNSTIAGTVKIQGVR